MLIIVVFQNNTPCYLIKAFGQDNQAVADEEVMEVSARLCKKNREAYESLAK